MDTTLDILKTYNVDNLNAERQRLLCVLMCLIQENVELRINLKDLEKMIRDRSPLGGSKKDSKDSKKVKQCQRIVGEIAFELDRMILCIVFPEQERRYGYCVANIKEKIKQMTTCPLTGKVDKQLRSELNQRYHHIMEGLKKLGYDHKVHSSFIEYVVNTYGIMKWKTTCGGEDKSSMSDPQYLCKMITEHMPSDEVENILIILNCLAFLCELTGSSMFLW